MSSSTIVGSGLGLGSGLEGGPGRRAGPGRGTGRSSTAGGRVMATTTSSPVGGITPSLGRQTISSTGSMMTFFHQLRLRNLNAF